MLAAHRVRPKKWETADLLEISARILTGFPFGSLAKCRVKLIIGRDPTLCLLKIVPHKQGIEA